jgi:hypothetical protein
MLLKVNTESFVATRVRGQRLRDFGLNERDLQGILFHSIDRLFPDDELLLIKQSQQWQEEPDLMALDKNGRLYIFELKVWESKSENLLQVLRYGQIYGNHSYDNLQRLYGKSKGQDKDLRAAHKALFNTELQEEQFNCEQVFVVMTNGLDFKTREAVQYWRKSGLDVRPWIYRVYRFGSDEMFLEITPFSVEDNPYSDFAEGYYILNTNYSNSREDHDDMLSSQKAAAYFAPWKNKIERLERGNIVFLYQSGTGIVAVGTASGKLKKRAYQNNPEFPDEEYAMQLRHFKILEQPVSAAEIKEITGVNYRFMSTMFALDEDSGKILYEHVLSQDIGRHSAS